MSTAWQHTVLVDGAQVEVCRVGDTIEVSGQDTRRYQVINGLCRRCSHPSVSGNTCSTCCDWKGLERVVAMGKYVPRNRRTDDDLLDLSEDLWNAKRDRSLSLLLGAVLAAFVENEHPMLLRYSVVTTVPSFEPPGHTEYLLEAFCYNTSHDGCRTDLLTKTMDISLTGKPRDRRRELAPRIYHAGLGQVSHGSTVLILDDILTDGATMDRCASVLREMGASRVVGLVVARTV